MLKEAEVQAISVTNPRSLSNMSLLRIRGPRAAVSSTCNSASLPSGAY